MADSALITSGDYIILSLPRHCHCIPPALIFCLFPLLFPLYSCLTLSPSVSACLVFSLLFCPLPFPLSVSVSLCFSLFLSVFAGDSAWAAGPRVPRDSRKLRFVSESCVAVSDAEAAQTGRGPPHNFPLIPGGPCRQRERRHLRGVKASARMPGHQQISPCFGQRSECVSGGPREGPPEFHRSRSPPGSHPKETRPV